MFLEFGNHLCRNNSSFHCVFTSEHFLIFYSKSMKTEIVTDHCRKCGDEKRMCGQKASPDEFQIFSVLIGAFCVYMV